MTPRQEPSAPFFYSTQDPVVHLNLESVLQRAICHVGVDETVALSSSAEAQQR